MLFTTLCSGERALLPVICTKEIEEKERADVLIEERRMGRLLFGEYGVHGLIYALCY